LLLQAGIDGVGFLMTFEGYVREALDDGRLVPVLEGWCVSFPGPFLYYPSRRQSPPALRAFIDFAKDWRSSAKHTKPARSGSKR
jgi:DNA-binding transcriptional LysR family regulator